MKYLGLLAAEMLMIALGGRLAHSADLDSFSQPSPDYLYGSSFRQPNVPMEMGTGWYFRMDSNISRSLLPILSSTGAINSGTKLSGISSYGLGFGYKLNSLLRADINFESGGIQKTSSSTTKLNDGKTNIVCPAALVVIKDSQSNPLGYSWNEQVGTCTETRSFSTRNMFVMANAYVDLGTFAKITPYVGAGIGVARIPAVATDNFYSNDSGLLFEPKWTQGGAPNIWLGTSGAALTPQPTIPNTSTPVSTLISPAWNHRTTSLSYNLAWSAMAGAAFDLTPNAKLDIGYRYLNFGTSLIRRYSQDVRVGFRYMVD